VIDAAGDGAGAAKSAAPAQAPAPTPAPKAAEPAERPHQPRAPRSFRPRSRKACRTGTRCRCPTCSRRRTSASAGERIHSSPLVRRMAKEHGIDLATIPGTGAGRPHQQTDIEAYLAGGAQPPLKPMNRGRGGGLRAVRSGSAARRRSASSPPATSGGQTHVAFESAVQRKCTSATTKCSP